MYIFPASPNITIQLNSLDEDYVMDETNPELSVSIWDFIG